jgi:hypothetical protein
MVPQKVKNLTLERGILWDSIILKSESPYCAFTLHRYTTFVSTNIFQSPTLWNKMK